MTTHIDGFGAENFRVFKDLTNFDFAPITILTGTNSSGKSSLTKAIMLLKNSYLKSNFATLDFSDQNLKLGSFEQNLSFGDTRNDMSFQIRFSQNNSLSFTIVGDDFRFKGPANNIDITNFDRKNIIKFDLSFFSGEVSKFSHYLNQKKILELVYKFEQNEDTKIVRHKLKEWFIKPSAITYNESFDDLVHVLNINSDVTSQLKLEIERFIQTRIKFNYTIMPDFSNFIYQDFKDIVDGINALGSWNDFYYEEGIVNVHEPLSNDSILKEILSDDLISRLPDKLAETKLATLIDEFKFENFEPRFLNENFTSIHYIPGVRANQEIVFTIEKYPLLVSILRGMDSGKPTSVTSIIKDAKSNYFLSKWLVQEFKIIKDIKDLVIDVIEGYGIQIKLNKDLSLFQVGYGVTQLLPIILQIALLKNSVFIIEEPEANLHPALQSKLADMFIDAAETFGIQFIIETHSEYLIRRLQTRTAEFYIDKKKNQPSISKECTQIYYFYSPDQGPEDENQIYPINIMEDGSLTKNFGKGFYDEAGNEDLLLYQLAKFRKN